MKYCSASCRDEAISFEGADNPNYQGGADSATCRFCGTDFEYYPSEKRGLYCPTCVESEPWKSTPTTNGSDNPQWSGGKRTVACTVCGTNVERWPSELSDNPVCSEECRRTWLSEAFTGAGHPNWKGGGNPSYGKGWNEVRQLALERDDYRCRVCDANRDDIGRNPDVHHIVPVRWYIDSDEHSREDAHRLNNVVSLCQSCHRKAEHASISRDRLRSLLPEDTRDDE